MIPLKPKLSGHFVFGTGETLNKCQHPLYYCHFQLKEWKIHLYSHIQPRSEPLNKPGSLNSIMKVGSLLMKLFVGS